MKITLMTVRQATVLPVKQSKGGNIDAEMVHGLVF